MLLLEDRHPEATHPLPDLHPLACCLRFGEPDNPALYGEVLNVPEQISVSYCTLKSGGDHALLHLKIHLFLIQLGSLPVTAEGMGACQSVHPLTGFPSK